MSTLKVKAKDGQEIQLVPVELNISEIKSFLEENTGICIGDDGYDNYAIAIWRYWDAFRGSLYHKKRQEILKATMQLFAYQLQLCTGGFAVYDVKDEATIKLLMSTGGGGIILNVGDLFIQHLIKGNEPPTMKMFEVEYGSNIDAIRKELSKLIGDYQSLNYMAEDMAKEYFYQGQTKSVSEYLLGFDGELRDKVQAILTSERMIKFGTEFYTIPEYDKYFEENVMNYEKLLKNAVNQEEYELASKVRDKINERKQNKKSKK